MRHELTDEEQFLRGQIDCCQFAMVRHSVEQPGSLGISVALVVDPSVRLEHAAAVAALGDAKEWDHLLDAGLVRQAAMTTATDDTSYRVIYLPGIPGAVLGHAAAHRGQPAQMA